MFASLGKKSRRWLLLGGLGLLGLGVAGFFVLQSQRASASASKDEVDQAATDAAKLIPVELAAVSRRDIPNYFHATGALEARRSVDLVAKLSGQVQKVAVEEGQSVAAGDVLLEVDHREQELLTGKAQVLAETAQRELDRVLGIAERGLATDKELEAARRDAEVSDFEFKLAQQRLSDHRVRAPFAGIITVRSVELGQTITAGLSVFRLVDSGPMELRLHLPEALVDQLRTGQDVILSPDAGSRRELAGHIERIAPAVDAGSSTIKVTVRVPAQADVPRSGSFVRARITTDLHRATLAIPKRALVAEAGAQYVFVAEADSVRKVEIQTGYADAEHTEVIDGLKDGDRVVVVGHGGLRHGSRIRDLAVKEEHADAAADEQIARGGD